MIKSLDNMFEPKISKILGSNSQTQRLQSTHLSKSFSDSLSSCILNIIKINIVVKFSKIRVINLKQAITDSLSAYRGDVIEVKINT